MKTRTPGPLAVLNFKMPEGSAPVACVDVGGTKVAVCVADPRGIHGRLAEPTVKEGASDALGRQVLRMIDRKSTRLNSSHIQKSRMPSSA